MISRALIQFRYPGDDYRDLMLGVDEMLKRSYIDANRLGVTGGSGGGLLTNWVIGFSISSLPGTPQPADHGARRLPA